MAEQLQPRGDPRHRRCRGDPSPGLTGEVEVHLAGTAGMRGEEQATADLQQALASAAMEEQLSVVISRHAELRPASRHPRQWRCRRHRRRGARPGRRQRPGAALRRGGRLAVVAPARRHRTRGRAVARRRAAAATGCRGRSSRPTSASRAGHRGLLGAVGTKVLKVLVFPLVDPVLGGWATSSPRAGRRATGSTGSAGWGSTTTQAPTASSLRPGTTGPGSARGAPCCSCTAPSPRHTARFGALPRRRWRHCTTAYDGRVARLRPPLRLGLAEGERRPVRVARARRA